MSTKNIQDGQERFDGFAVTQYEGKFSGGFDLDENLAKDVAFDDVVTFVVTGRVSGVTFGENKLGDIRRINAFHVTNAVELDPAVAAQLLAGVPDRSQIPGQQTIQDAAPPAERQPAAVTQGVPVEDPVLAAFLSNA